MSPSSAAEIAEMVRTHSRLVVRCHGTKPRLSLAAEDTAVLDLSQVTGMVEYDPGEFTFTARAGSRVAEIAAELATQGQYLPFDPMLVESGASLGGMVASGLSGPGRLRFGGIRDFILGVEFVDGRGSVVHGGGKVVKNAAGFDFPKLLTGSLGRFGVMTQLTFKVFPAPEASLSASIQCQDAASAAALIGKLAQKPFDLDALDFEPPGLVTLRISGIASALTPRFAALQQFAGDALQRLAPQDASTHWRSLLEWSWSPQNSSRIKIPITLHQIAALEPRLAQLQIPRRYSVAGNIALLAWPEDLGESALEQLLADCGLSALVLDGPAPKALCGMCRDAAVRDLIKKALDPEGKFPSFN